MGRLECISGLGREHTSRESVNIVIKRKKVLGVQEDHLDMIKDYLRTTDEFSGAYTRLKLLYQKEYFAFCDSLDLVSSFKAEDIAYCEFGPIYARLNDDYCILALTDCRMVLTTIEYVN